VADVAPQTVELVEADAMTVDYGQLLQRAHVDQAPTAVHVVGNLPFNIATPLLLRFLAMIDRQDGICFFASQNTPTTLTLAFQREVANRIVAAPETPIRSRLSVMVDYYCNAKEVFVIPGRLFVPAPQVDAAIVNFTPREALKRPGIVKKEDVSLVSFQNFETVSRALFHQRRKLVSHGLLKLLQEEYRPNTTMEEARGFAARCGIDPTVRTHQLTTAQIARISLEYGKVHHLSHV